VFWLDQSTRLFKTLHGAKTQIACRSRDLCSQIDTKEVSFLSIEGLGVFSTRLVRRDSPGMAFFRVTSLHPAMS
jgi:hypothetical protein